MGLFFAILRPGPAIHTCCAEAAAATAVRLRFSLAADAVEERVQHHRHQRARAGCRTPAAAAIVRQVAEEAGAASGIRPKPIEIATTNRLKRLFLKSDSGEDARAGRRYLPNITSPAPPSTTTGMASTSAAIFGSKPSTA